MRWIFLIGCFVLPSMFFVAGGAAAAAQSDTFPALEKLLKDEKFEAALVVADKATRDNPGSAQAYFLLGRTQFYREQDDAARAAFEKAIALKPAFAEAMFFHGLTFNYGAQPDRARADFEMAARVNPNEPKYWFELGKSHQRAGNSDAATLALKKAIELDPKRAPALFALGTLAYDRGERAQAVLMWEKVLEVDPLHVDAHWNLGLHHQLRGDPKISLAHYLAAFAQKPPDVDGLKKVLQAYYRLADFDNAAAYRLKLLDLIAKSDDPKIRAMKEFCFDQFDAPQGRFFVYESLNKDASLFYWFTFRLVNEEGNVIKTINLESSKFLVETGVPFLLGQDEGRVHSNFGLSFKNLPAYPDLKKLVLEAHAGKLRVAASLTRPEKRKPGGN
jgi:tetratricopeptide (TPR) repeat protein